ncbi:hypothetical protein GCM10028806_14830 [Spirosoma terrae]|uniref:Exo-alpha-sialidase n=1 Tax=Spirosoma terrae TaxID=1968276 RepID=A0A6L9L8P6_9BACT|nr:sialidase family protein [Spirosoma terrae]NDU95133.1 exo-alpha-sialidase [Spirosoma terrae]
MIYAILLPMLLAVSDVVPVPSAVVSNPQSSASTPRLTTDAAGNPLLSWVEKGEQTSKFYYALSTDGGRTFGEKKLVKTPATFSTHAEGMPKVAVKADGTVLAVFEVQQPTPESRFAGDLLYTLSTDQGKSWSEPISVHQDTSPGKKARPTTRSFSDVTRLPNGEIGIVWLDEKLPNREGRPVLFAQTTKGAGFGSATVVDDNACQCCRTNVFVDAKKNIHLTYRDLLPSTQKGEIASRDISTAVSTDGGKTFGKPQPVFADHWRVNACPHAGPVVAETKNGMAVTWFSGVDNSAGVRLAQLGVGQLLSIIPTTRARHPYVTATADQLIWLWDEAVSKDGSGEMGSFVQRIGFRMVAGQEASPVRYVTPETVDATYPTALATEKGILMAYEQTQAGQKTAIVTQLLPLKSDHD